MSSKEESLNSEKELEQFYEERQSNMEEKIKNKNIKNLKNLNNNITNSSIDMTNFPRNKVLLYENYKNSSIKRSFVISPKSNKLNSTSNELCNYKNLKDSKTMIDNTFDSSKNSNYIKRKLSKNNSMQKLNSTLYNKFRTSNLINTNIKMNKNNDSPKFQILHSSKWKYRPLSNRVYKLNKPSLSTKNIFEDDSNFKNNNNIKEKNLDNRNLTKSSSSINLTKSGLSLPNEKYFPKNSENEISRIYTLRNYILNNLDDINKLNEDEDNIKNNTNDHLRKFYDNNMKFLNNKNKRNKLLYEKKIFDELSECSFHPKLTQSTVNLIEKTNYVKSKKNDDFYKKSILWKKNHDKELQNARTKKEKKDFEECYFHPLTNIKQHEEVLENLKDKSEDYIYEKNIKWLKQRELNKKKGEMEKEEKREIEIEKFKNENKFLVNLGNEINKLNPTENLEFNLSKPKYINTKYAKNKFNDVRNKSLDERCKWLKTKFDPDENFISYDKYLTINNDLNTNSLKKAKNKIEEHSDMNYNFNKEIKNIKSLISTLKNLLSENKNVIKDN